MTNQPTPAPTAEEQLPEPANPGAGERQREFLDAISKGAEADKSAEMFRSVISAQQENTDRLLSELAEKAAEIAELEKPWDSLVAKYQCNPTSKLSSFEAIRNHLEVSHRLCNENHDWAKRLESKLRAVSEAMKGVDAPIDIYEPGISDAIKSYYPAEEIEPIFARICAIVDA